MMDIIQKLAGMLQGGGGNHHAQGMIPPAAGNPAIPLGMSPQALGQYGGNYAAGAPMGGKPGMNPQATPGINPDVSIAGGPAGMPGPKPDAGVLPGGENKWTDLLLRGMKGAQAGMDASQKQQATQTSPQWSPMQLAAPQGAIIQPNNKQLPYQGRKY